jgi:hypothetical protein
LSEEVKELYSKILIIDLKISNIIFDIKKFAYTIFEMNLEEKEYKFLSLRGDSTNNEYEFTTEKFLEGEKKTQKILKEENEDYSIEIDENVAIDTESCTLSYFENVSSNLEIEPPSESKSIFENGFKKLNVLNYPIMPVFTPNLDFQPEPSLLNLTTEEKKWFVLLKQKFTTVEFKPLTARVYCFSSKNRPNKDVWKKFILKLFCLKKISGCIRGKLFE